MPRRFREPLLVALALALYWVMAVSVSSRMGVTADEVVHVTGGYSYWKFNDYRLHPENGTLPMRVAALPLLGMKLKFPPLDDPDWVNSKVNLVGATFFNQLGNPVPEMMQRARAAVALFGVLTCWLVWRWARGLFGPAGGWLALALAIFCPALLAHGGLATSDAAFTACALAALSAVWRLLHRATWGRLLVATVACAACFLAKMSGGIIVPIIGLLWLLRGWRRAPYVVDLGGSARWLRRRAAVLGVTFGLLVAVAAGSLLLVWANYSFRDDPFNRRLSPTTGFYFSWDVILDREPVPWVDRSALAPFVPRPHRQAPGLMNRVVGAMRATHLLPEAYLWGLAHTAKFARERPAFFHGEYRNTGWRLFFPVAFVMKTTLPALALFAAGLAGIAAWRRRGVTPAATAGVRFRGSFPYRAAPLLIFFVIFWLMAVQMTLNLGHRHILPVYPAFYILAAGSVLWLAGRARRMWRLALFAAVALHAADSLSARPFYLSYFQPLFGGPRQAYHTFVESSLDWGQGLPDLKTWLDAKAARGDGTPVFLTYFGVDWPANRGIAVTRFGDEMSDSGARPFPAQVRGGWYVISATYFQGAFLPMRGTWAAPQEALYGRLLQRLREIQPRLDRLGTEERKQAAQDATDFEALQFARLCHFLRSERREPDDFVGGGSLLVFKLTDDDVRRALYGPLPFTPAP